MCEMFYILASIQIFTFLTIAFMLRRIRKKLEFSEGSSLAGLKHIFNLHKKKSS